MRKRRFGWPPSWIAVWICLVLASATWVLFFNEASRSELAAACRSALRRPTGFPQLVRVEPLPDMEGPMCEWVPASSQDTGGQRQKMSSQLTPTGVYFLPSGGHQGNSG